MNIHDFFLAVFLIGALMLLGKVIRRFTPILQRLFLPSSIIGGTIALLIGPQVMGRFFQDTERMQYGLWPESIQEIWSSMPALLISVVFASLFLGKAIPGPQKIWQQAGPMVAHGQTIAWGQYVVGISLAVLLLTPVFGISPMSGALIEIGFEGGHGTAAGLGDTFRSLGFEDGADLALGLATVGVVMGVLIGTALINWAVWKGHMPRPESFESSEEKESICEHENREFDRKKTTGRDQAMEPLSIHIGFIAVAIGIGWLILEGMVRLETSVLIPLGWPELLAHIPLFPLAMVGGVIIQIAAERLGFSEWIDRGLINRISGTALDILIVAAMATLSLEAIGTHAWAFIILAAAGIAWNLFGYLVLARWMFPEKWAVYGLANFGQGIGMTVIGLLLVRMSDPKGRSGAMEAFGYKQLMFEPVVGGGLFTAASLPLIHQFGALPVLAGVTVLMAGWLVFGIMCFRPS